MAQNADVEAQNGDVESQRTDVESEKPDVEARSRLPTPNKSSQCNDLFTPQRHHKVVNFMSFDEDDDLVVFRKFKRLNVSSLLFQQNQLAELEQKMDLIAKGKSSEALLGPLSRAGPMLQAYNTALLQQAQLLKLPKPTDHLVDFLIDVSQGLWRELGNFISADTRDDLVSLASTPKGPIHKRIDRTDFLRRRFLKEPVDDQPRGLEVYYERHARRVENIVVNILFCALILVPIGVFHHVKSVTGKIMLVVAATLAASLITGAILTDFHRFNLTVMFGYTAILVVFLSNSV